MSIEDKLFKTQQKVDALTDSFTENDPILTRNKALKNKLVFDQLAKMSNPRISLVDKLYSMGETNQRIQAIEEQEKAYKINKIADPSRYDNSYVDQKTGEVKKYSDLINYDREIEDYSLWGATKTAATRGTAELLQGTGKGLQWLTNQTGKGLETAGTLLGDVTNSLLTGEKIYADKYNEINKKWDNNTIGALDVTNAIAKPLNEAAKKINYKNIYNSTDDINQAFSESLVGGVSELSNAIAHTLIGSAPEVAPALFGVVPGVLAGAGSFMARADKERQAKALGVSPDDIMEVSPNMTPEDLIGGAIYGGLNLVDAGILKNAIGKGLISKLSDGTIGLSSKADNATKNAFAKLRESNPSLDAWLKPEGVGAKALVWTGDKAWKLGKTTGKVGGKVGIAAGLEGGAEMGQTLMEQWANGDLKDRSWDENWKDIKEAGLMGAYVGGSLKAPHAVYQEGKEVINTAMSAKKETKALEKYVPAADKALGGGNAFFDKLDDEKFGENLSKEDIEGYKADFNDIINTSPDASIDDINNFLNDENNRDAVIKTIYLAKNGKLGSEAAKSIVESYNNLINTILSDSNPNEAILNSKSILEKIMYAVNLRDTNFVRALFNSAISKSQSDTLNSPENASKDVAKTLETYIAIMENLRDTLAKGIEQTKSLLGNTYSETKDKASIAYMNKMVNTIKKTSAQVGMEIIQSGFTTMDGNKKESVMGYMNILNSKNDINILKNTQRKLETYRNGHRAKAVLYNFLKNSSPLNPGDIAIIPRFSTNPNDIRIMSKKQFEQELQRINKPKSHFTVFESRYSNPTSYETSVENMLNNVQNELDMIEDTYNEYSNKINKLAKQNTQSTTDNSSNKQESKPNEKSKQEQSSPKKELVQDNSKKDAVQEKIDEVKTKNDEDSINIYSTSNNKFSYLTNVTKFPLVLNIAGVEYHFTSVEHAYQSLKHNDFSKPINEWTLAKVYDNTNWKNVKKIRSELRENRENNSNIKIMEYLISERAKQDSKFMSLLKETGNATLTHNEDNTIWKEEFPRILMDIRSGKEIAKPQTTQATTSSNTEKKVTPVNDIIKNTDLNDFDSLLSSFKKLREIYKGKLQGDSVEKMCKALGEYKIGRDFLQALLDMKVVHGNSPKSVVAIQNTLDQYKNQSKETNENSNQTTLIIGNGVNEAKDLANKGLGVYTLRLAGDTKIRANIEGIEYLDANHHFGNPFLSTRNFGNKGVGTDEEVSQKFEDWLLGKTDQNIEPSRRQWILDIINSGKLDNAQLIYYANTPINHAKKLQEIIKNRKNNAGLLNGTKINNTQDNNKQENTTSLDNEQEASNENLDDIKSNSINISEDNSIISFLKNNIKKSEIISKLIENIEKIFNSENVKKIKTFAFALGDKVSLNKNTISQLADINNLSNIKNLINSVFEKGYLGKFEENCSNLLKSIKDNYDRNLSTGSYTFKLDSYSVAKKTSKGDEIISTAPGAVLLDDERTRVSMALRGIETLLSIQFNTQYRSVIEMQEHLEKVFGKDSKIHINNYDILKILNETSIESSLLSDIGRNIINDLGIKWKDKEIGEIQQSYVEQELGRYTLDILEKMGLIERYSIKNKEIFEESNDQEAQINLIKVKERLFSKERDKSNSPRVMLDKLNNIFEKLGLDRNNNRVSYKFGKGFGKLWDNWGKTTKGKDKKLYKKAAKAIQISRNTKFVAKSKDYLMSFLSNNFNGSNPADILIKASEGYTPNLQEKIDKLQSALQHGEVNNDALVLFSEIESKKGKNLGIENEVNNLLELITNPEIDNGVFFDYRISKNEREFMQSDGANPQAHKISRFLVVPEYLFSRYTKGKNGEIIGKNGKENIIAYQHIAQAFGMGTDKVASEKSIAFGKSILALDFTKLEKAVAEAMNNGKQEFEVDGIELSIAELGHALSAMAALNSYHNAKAGENFEAAILGEADGINNGIAIKLLQYMLHPKYVELLKGTGIDFFNQLSDNISDYFSGKTYDEKSGEKLLDLYQIIAKQFNGIVDNAIRDIDTTINNTKNGLSQKNRKIKNLLNNKSANNAISTIAKNLTYTLHDLFKLNPDGSIAKSARTFVKPMVQVFGYGAGDKSQINGLINAFMETFERKVLDYIDGNKQENKFYYDTIKAVYFLVHGNLPNNEEEIKKAIKNSLIYGVKQISSKGTEYTVPLLNAKTKTENITGFDIIKNILETQLKDTIVETMQNTFPGIREQSQLINEITNERIELVQKHYERLKNAKLKFLKENGENREYLTKQELEEIRDNIQKFLPGMTLSIASIEELGDIEAKHYFENTKSQTNLNGMNSQSFLGSGKDKNNATINPKETVYLDNGAGTNVIAIHQRDGSAMLATVVETAKKIGKHFQRIFLGIHDAVVTDANSSLEIQNKINEISYKMDINNNQLAQFEDIARKNIIIAEDLIKGIPDEHTQKERLDIEVKKLTAKFQTLFRMVSEYNREILSRYKVSYNNIQNGNKGSAYILDLDNALNDNISGQELKNLLISYTENSLIINALETFKDIKTAIRVNEKDLFGNIGFRENELALKPIKEELADTIDMVDAAIEKLEILMDKKLKSLDNKNIDNSQNIDNFEEISFNNKYKNVINAITKAINKNNVKGIKEAYEAVDGNERGFRQAINKYLNSLDNMSESYKTNFKNKIKEALNIDIDKKLSGSKKAREEIEENITDENLKEALNKEIDNIEQTELMNSTNDEFKDFKQSNNVLNSPENKNNKNKLNSVENTEQNNNDTETTAIPILDDIQNNPNAISEMQDNLRDLDKQNGRSIDEEHSNILKKVLNKVTGTLSQSVGNLKVLLSHTNATNNAGEYNREINAITIKHSTNPRYSGYMGAELTYAHEMIHAATSFAVRYMQGNNKFTHMLSTAYDLFLHNANAETIAEHLTQIPNIQERHRIANMLFDHMTENEDSLTNLEEFLAIALTDKAMIEILQSIPYKEESKTLFQKIRDTFFEIFDTIFGDNILKVKKNGSTYDMLVSLAVQMGKTNQNAKNEVVKNKSQLREMVDFAREEMDEKLSGVIKTSLAPVKKFLVKEMVTNTSDSWLGHIRYHAASGVLAMCSKDYQDNLRKELSDTYITLNNDTVYGAIIDDLSTPNAMSRLAQRAQRESSRIDAKRETFEYCTGQTLKNFFKTPLSKYESQSMGEVLLDTDITSLDMDINDIQTLLRDEKTLNNKIKEFKNKIDNKKYVGQELGKKYKNYIHNRSVALAYKMVTGKNIDNAVVLNAYNIVNYVGTNIRYGNPGTKFDMEFKNELTKDVDQYITLLALKLMDRDMKKSVANVMDKDTEATEKVMNFIKNFNKNSQKDLFDNNKIQTIKGYRRDVYNNDKEIIWADASKEKELAKEGYKKISESLPKNASDKTNENRCMYVNTFISQQTNFTRQAIRYTKGTSRGHEIRDLINHEIYENPEKVNELERLYFKSMQEAKDNFKKDFNTAMSSELPVDMEVLNKMSKETNLQPILDEAGNISSFSYQMSKDVKKDVLALDTDIFKSLGKMQSNYYDKNASKDLNNRIADILINDYKVASKNPLELDKMFIELSHNTKDPLKREIYKMLDYETRTKLEKAMGGKIMVRKDTFTKFFGVRDMDVRNAKWFKKMSNVEVKKTIIFTAEMLKMITKLFKLETVVRTPAIFIGNQVSNIWQCINYGIPLLDTFKLHREAVVNLRRYQSGKIKLMELELKAASGEKVNEASIKALKASLQNNPVYPLVVNGFLNTIIEDLDRPAKGYFEEKYAEFYNNRSSIGKGIIDWAFLTEKTLPGKVLTEYVHMADFLSRYTLYYGLKNQGKLSETQIIDEVSDAFIDYDMITNRGIKMLNDYGFALFTRFFTRSQRLLKNHLVDRPFTTAALLVTQSHLGEAFDDSIYNTVFWNKNYDYMLGIANPIYNAIDVLSPSGLKLIPGMGDFMSTTNLRSASMFI